MRELLLRPSLTDTPASAGVYSINWILLPTFLLGPGPVIVYSAFNSWRLRRAWDAVAYLLSIAGLVGLMYVMGIGPVTAAERQFAEWTGSSSPLRTATRVYAVLPWALFYLMHRSQHRSTGLLGNAPSPWRVGIASCVLGVGLTWGIVEVMKFALLAARTV